MYNHSSKEGKTAYDFLEVKTTTGNEITIAVPAHIVEELSQCTKDVKYESDENERKCTAEDGPRSFIAKLGVQYNEQAMLQAIDYLMNGYLIPIDEDDKTASSLALRALLSLWRLSVVLNQRRLTRAVEDHIGVHKNIDPRTFLIFAARAYDGDDEGQYKAVLTRLDDVIEEYLVSHLDKIVDLGFAWQPWDGSARLRDQMLGSAMSFVDEPYGYELLQRLMLVAPRAALFATLLFGLTRVIEWVHNAYFHPLAKYPGPWLARASTVPLLYHRSRGRLPHWLAKLHAQHGPVVRYFPGGLSYIDPKAWNDIYGPRSKGGGLPKAPAIALPMFGGKDSMIFMDDDDHNRIRRLLSHAMSERALREQHDVILEHVDLLIAKVKSVAKGLDAGRIDLVRWYNFASFDIIADLSFGESLGMLQQGEWTPWIKAINDAMPFATLVAVASRCFPILAPLLNMSLASMRQALRTHTEYSKNQVDRRLSRDTDRTDFWKYILRAQNSKDTAIGVSPAENQALGMTLMVAGSETTATALSGLTNCLLNSPNELEKLTCEIRQAFSSPAEMNEESLARLPYLGASIEEALRLYPPAPVGLERSVPAGGHRICGEFVPEGTHVLVTHWVAYGSPALWHRPEDFLPERWLVENRKTGPFATDVREVLQPFAYGPRNCIGKNLAYNEIRLIAAQMLWHFDLELCDESRNWQEQKIYGLAVKGPLVVRPRLANEVA